MTAGSHDDQSEFSGDWIFDPANTDKVHRLIWDILTEPDSLDDDIELSDSEAYQDDLDLLDDLLATLALQGTYYISSGHSLALTLSNIGYTDTLQDANSYQELVANLLYNLNF